MIFRSTSLTCIIVDHFGKQASRIDTPCVSIPLIPPWLPNCFSTIRDSRWRGKRQNPHPMLYWSNARQCNSLISRPFQKHWIMRNGSPHKQQIRERRGKEGATGSGAWPLLGNASCVVAKERQRERACSELKLTAPYCLARLWTCYFLKSKRMAVNFYSRSLALPTWQHLGADGTRVYGWQIILRSRKGARDGKQSGRSAGCN